MRSIIGYRVIDRHTGQQVGRDYPASSGPAARRRADRLDLNYGACRYVVSIIWGA